MKRKTSQGYHTSFRSLAKTKKYRKKIVEKLEKYEHARIDISKPEVISDPKHNKFKKYAPTETNHKSRQPSFRASPNSEDSKNNYLIK